MKKKDPVKDPKRQKAKLKRALYEKARKQEYAKKKLDEKAAAKLAE